MSRKDSREIDDFEVRDFKELIVNILVKYLEIIFLALLLIVLRFLDQMFMDKTGYLVILSFKLNLEVNRDLLSVLYGSLSKMTPTQLDFMQKYIDCKLWLQHMFWQIQDEFKDVECSKSVYNSSISH